MGFFEILWDSWRFLRILWDSWGTLMIFWGFLKVCWKILEDFARFLCNLSRILWDSFEFFKILEDFGGVSGIFENYLRFLKDLRRFCKISLQFVQDSLGFLWILCEFSRFFDLFVTSWLSSRLIIQVEGREEANVTRFLIQRCCSGRWIIGPYVHIQSRKNRKRTDA